MTSILQRFYAEIGLNTVISAPADVKVLCFQRFVRLAAYGSSTLILALYLSSLGNSDEKIGLFISLTLLGDVVISLVLTVLADGIGRRRMLGLGSLLMTASGIVFANYSNYWVLVAASVLGVISPSGNEIGPFKAIEESTISQLTSSSERSSIFAWYILFGTIGVAVGTIATGTVVHHLQVDQRWEPMDSYRVTFWAYAVMGLVNFCLSLALSTKSETQEKTYTDTLPNNDESRPLLLPPENAIGEHEANTNPYSSLSSLNPLHPFLSRESQSLVFKICLLFAIDSIASGLTPASLVTYFFNLKFDLTEDKLGALFFSTNVISSASNLVASSIARRIGLIKTMVLTHVPASIALALIPLPSNVIAAMALLIFRSSTNSMDQAPRQAFLAAAVLPSERTAVMGIVNVVKTLSQSLGPVVTGALASRDKFWIAFVISGGLKIVYDILMLAMFLGYRTREERAQEQDTETEEAEQEESADEASGTRP